MITAHGVNGHVAFRSAKVCAVIATFAERKPTFPMPAPLLSTCPQDFRSPFIPVTEVVNGLLILWTLRQASFNNQPKAFSQGQTYAVAASGTR